ncbi:hypothetical protein BB560_006755 [Smittium megazygosporum]|uniref:Glycogen debranching enzyme n=1 Tax=Smittium megazygosporum TaxID=133381 RepID=A0A2T9Y1W9_9FUNG|nr:hypothetical protein BB560_006755 [Smittium megazygosporum]
MRSKSKQKSSKGAQKKPDSDEQYKPLSFSRSTLELVPVSNRDPSLPLVVWEIEFNSDGTIVGGKNFVNINPIKGENVGLRLKIPAGSLMSIDPVLRTNYPIEGKEYDRNFFHPKEFTVLQNDDLICEFLIERPGPYQYYIEYKSYKGRTDYNPTFSDSSFDSQSLSQDPSNQIGGLKPNKSYPDLLTHSYEMEELKTNVYYFQVNPELRINGSFLSLDAICLKSMNPRLMGPISDWETHFKNSAALGYNMLHFLPIQERGSSDSPYSIYDQLEFAKSLFEGCNPPIKTSKDRDSALASVLSSMEKDHGIIGVVDIVLNHTANNSKWLEFHPEAGFNLVNSPHLRAAYEVDRELVSLCNNISKYKFREDKISNMNDLYRLMGIIEEQAIKNIKLWEFYVLDLEATIQSVKDIIQRRPNSPDYRSIPIDAQLQREFSWMDYDSIINKAASILIDSIPNVHNVFARFSRKLDPSLCYSLVVAMMGSDSKLEEVVNCLKNVLDIVNLKFYREYDDDVKSILTNIRNTIEHERLSGKSWKSDKPVCPAYPLIDPYFTVLPKNSTTAKLSEDELALANNGWIWGGNPMENFASDKSKSYIRREVIVWGDCVKLNYGSRPEDNPYVWKHMCNYVSKMAEFFQGFRLDNCHSTPLELAEYMLDQARLVRPNLYVIAELFTGQEAADEKFVSRLGINSLIRESINAWDIQELSRIVHRNGGIPIGALDICLLRSSDTFSDSICGFSDVPCSVAPLRYTLPHSIFFDLTHDNEAPAQVRTPEDALSSAATVGFTVGAIGSSQGFDDLYPKYINLVQEQRRYPLLSDPINSGIGRAKKEFNFLHQKISGFEEIFVGVEGEFLTIHRIDPLTRTGYFMITRPAFKGVSGEGHHDPIRFGQTKVEPVFSYGIEILPTDFSGPSDGYIHGFNSNIVDLGPPTISEFDDEDSFYCTLSLPKNFKPGSVLVVKTYLVDFDIDFDQRVKEEAMAPISELGLDALNVLLYRCSQEEYDTIGVNSYSLDGIGPLPYCGLQGWMNHLKHIIANNDLSHPLCDNLRRGNWAIDFTISRLEKYSSIYPELSKLVSWYSKMFGRVNKVPRNLLPKFFASVISTSYDTAIKRALSIMNPNFAQSSNRVTQLAMTSVQLVGSVKSSSLHPFEKLGSTSLCAGLPHFSTQYMRCWGRDIFIALDGLLLETHRWEDARRHLMAFGSVLRNGLIPNLLDSGRSPRYNARDATWFWLQAIQDYCSKSPEGLDFLNVPVPRRFPENEDYVEWNSDRAYQRQSLISDLIYEVLHNHANGIRFREWNAGTTLDEHMTSEGFNINIIVDWNSGLIFGGNKWNCGTWMDKMGSSEKAGNRGIPSTPRDGADIEIIGLLKSCLRWIIQVKNTNADVMPYEGVHVKKIMVPHDFASSNNLAVHEGHYIIPFTLWDDILLNNFEKYFYIPQFPERDSEYVIEKSYINRRGIYKDTFGSSSGWTDYQLRPNVCVAMVVAPELFDPKKARDCLHLVRSELQGPIGMRTLDPSDMQYRPYYDNTNDSDDPKLAHGANYHQGPEWLWCTGYFLRALLSFYSESKDMALSVYHDALSTLNNLHNHLKDSPYSGLTELTNMDGAFCQGSCPTQAWSSATLLSLRHDIENHESHNYLTGSD